METRELRYFVALAEELHFARAAARVGIEQSPLSKAISEMERRPGMQSFLRTRRSTHLTYVGEVLLQDARRVLGDVDQARSNLVATPSGRRGQLRIAMCDGLGVWAVEHMSGRIKHAYQLPSLYAGAGIIAADVAVGVAA
jgi:DNA-binding transcriptional LysR family regulator